MTKLGNAIARTPAAAPGTPVASRFAAAIAGSRPRRMVTVAGVEAPMLLVGAAQALAIDAEVERLMKASGFERSTFTSAAYEVEEARLVLAEAVRDPDDDSKPLGSPDDWGKLSRDEIYVAWLEYMDLRATVDPLGSPLSDQEAAAFADAVAKKNGLLLRAFGLTKLVNWLLTTGAPPSISPTQRSTSSPSSSETETPSPEAPADAT